jgi:NAD(P)-dependent dehydrogenase (short-subunit alcohol dehydrogenase family)
MQLANKVALVTGADSGIGKAAAILFAKEGAKVGVLDLKDDKLKNVVGEIEQADGEALAIAANISNPEDMQRAVQQIIDRWGRLDIVFANAGINGVWAPLEDLTPEDWNKTISTNLTGTFLTVKYAVPYLKKQGGSVIVTSSVNGTRIFSNTGATAYSCSKGAQVVFTKMVALELARHKVRVNVICPGGVQTNISENTEQRNVEREKIPVEFPEGNMPLSDGRSAHPDQIAQLVLFLASDASSHITGTEMWIDGGESLLMG